MKQKTGKFFLVIGVIFLVIIIGGFYPSFFFRSKFHDTSLPTFLIIHGIVMVIWYVIFFHQTLLVTLRKTINHRRNGMYWLVLIVLIYATGIGVLINVSQQVVTGDIPYPSLAKTIEGAAGLVLGNSYLMATSLILFVIAFINRKKPEIHKRAMLGASVLLLGPAWDRFIHPFELQSIHPLLKFVSINIFPVSLIIYDIIKRRKPYWITILFFLLMILMLPVIFSMLNMGWGEKLVKFIGS